jgi:hypothetical protein
MRVFIGIVFVCCALMASVGSSVAGAFLQASSTEEQIAADSSPKVVTMNSTDAASGITNQNGAVSVSADGNYFMVAAAQVGGKAKGFVRMWMRINGRDVDNSNTEQLITEPGFTTVLVCQGVVELKKADKVEMAYSGSVPGIGLVIHKPAGEPLVTSMIFSAFKLD